MPLYLWYGLWFSCGVVVAFAVNMTINSFEDDETIVKLRRGAAWAFVGVLITCILLVILGIDITAPAIATIGISATDFAFGLSEDKVSSYHESGF